MPRILPGQARARATSRSERLADLARGLPRSPVELRRSLRMLGMYRSLGWQRSVRAGLPVDAGGLPLPWFSYPALEWLGSALGGGEHVFEFGAGHSTLWLSGRVASVFSVEHDRAWVDELSRRVGPAVTLVHRDCGGDEDWAPEGDAYAASIDEHPRRCFDLVVVDGMARNRCMQHAVGHQPRMIILDNADRPAHHAAVDLASGAGYGRIDFVGPSVVQGVFSCTSLFVAGMAGAPAAGPGYPTFWGY